MIDQQYFDDLVTSATARLNGDEILLVSAHTESTAFARFNDARVRQAGSIEQTTIDVDLIEGKRHTEATVQLSGDEVSDQARVERVLERLR